MGLTKSHKLYKYQLDVVNWMKSVEDDVAVGKSRWGGERRRDGDSRRDMQFFILKQI
jgi:hypothetical protein